MARAVIEDRVGLDTGGAAPCFFGCHDQVAGAVCIHPDTFVRGMPFTPRRKVEPGIREAYWSRTPENEPSRRDRQVLPE